MKKYLLFFLAITWVASANEIKDRTEEIIKITFGDDILTTMEEYIISADIKQEIESACRQKFFKESVHIWRVFKNDKLSGYAILDNVYGKSLPITFLVIYDGDGNIIRSSVVKYREQYGGGVRNDKWHNQFIGKDKKSKFAIGEDIDALSGATISAGSVTTGIKKLTMLIDKIIE